MGKMPLAVIATYILFLSQYSVNLDFSDYKINGGRILLLGQAHSHKLEKKAAAVQLA